MNNYPHTDSHRGGATMASPQRMLMLVAVIVGLVCAGAWYLLTASEKAAPKAVAPVTAPQYLERAFAPADTSSVLKPGLTWRVSVWQNAGAAAPDAAPIWYESEYVFRVLGAPPRGDMWRVHATVPSAQGTGSAFADGADLYYSHDSVTDTFTLKQVGLAGGKPVEAEFGTLVLGADFPLEMTISATPPATRSDRLSNTGMSSVLPTMPG